MLKVINAQSANSTSDVSTVIIEELAAFSSGVKIKELQLIGGGGDGRKSLSQLAIMSETELRSIPVQRCDRASTCQECVALQDPYCAWEIRSNRYTEIKVFPIFDPHSLIICGHATIITIVTKSH